MKARVRTAGHWGDWRCCESWREVLALLAPGVTVQVLSTTVLDDADFLGDD
jgi:hypothetical protein